MVTPSAARGWGPNERNWKCVPSGMVMQTSGPTGTISSRPPCLRHISPRPVRKNQISSTVRCVTAVDVSPGASSKWAMPPRARPSKTRTSEPSGATASRSAGKRLVAKSLMPAPDGTSTRRRRRRRPKLYLVVAADDDHADLRQPQGEAGGRRLQPLGHPRPLGALVGGLAAEDLHRHQR